MLLAHKLGCWIVSRWVFSKTVSVRLIKIFKSCLKILKTEKRSMLLFLSHIACIPKTYE